MSSPVTHRLHSPRVRVITTRAFYQSEMRSRPSRTPLPAARILGDRCTFTFGCIQVTLHDTCTSECLELKGFIPAQSMKWIGDATMSDFADASTGLTGGHWRFQYQRAWAHPETPLSLLRACEIFAPNLAGPLVRGSGDAVMNVDEQGTGTGASWSTTAVSRNATTRR